jgi:hypothetical protein
MNVRLYGIWFICAGLLPASFSALKSGGNSGDLDYNKVVRPILSEHCFACHGPDSASRKAGLRLDRFDDAIAPRKDNKHAIVPGKPDESEAIRRVFTADEDDMMPPKKAKKELKPEEKEILKKWIAGGAKYKAHWSLLAPEKADFPKVKNDFEVQKNKIQLYSRQVFITDEVKDVVPDFLMLLHGVLDSPDIPLNVSRSYLQSDANVKKINQHITKKVGDKLG